MVATVPMLRGVWGVALRAESEACYCRLFEGAESERPRYLMRPAPQVAEPAPAVEFLLFPATTNLLDDRDDEGIAWTAWDRACRQGLGPQRHPFRISSAVPLAWDGSALEPARRQPGFVLEDLPWPAGTEETPCRLEFPAPLRLLRRASSSRHRLRPTSSWRPCTGSAPWPGPTPTRSGQRGGTGSSSVVLSPANPGRDAGSTLCATRGRRRSRSSSRCRRLARPSRRSRPPFAPPGRRGVDPHRQGDRDGPGPDQDHRLRPSGVGVPGTPFLTAWANSGKSGRATREQALRPMCIRQTRLEPLAWSPPATRERPTGERRRVGRNGLNCAQESPGSAHNEIEGPLVEIGPRSDFDNSAVGVRQ